MLSFQFIKISIHIMRHSHHSTFFFPTSCIIYSTLFGKKGSWHMLKIIMPRINIRLNQSKKKSLYYTKCNFNSPVLAAAACTFCLSMNFPKIKTESRYLLVFNPLLNMWKEQQTASFSRKLTLSVFFLQAVNRVFCRSIIYWIINGARLSHWIWKMGIIWGL